MSTKIKFMINNINLIKPLLNFDNDDIFYHLQILKRKKEHPELGSNSYTIKTYYIKSIEGLENQMGEIECLCNFHNARAYINLNPRSFEKTAFHTLKKITDTIMNKDYKSVRKAYNSVCGEYSNGNKDKKWIIDCDDFKLYELKPIMDFIDTLQPLGVKSEGIIPTKNGYHLITKPFNVEEFKKLYNLEIHKNNGTILMVP